ncbi:MFS transporter [Lichenicola cladoniae]|uniref:MFS transporter n=1 Tax=Lichenicola cladoniae TaxID=1484109 RepID=A0A6M8HJW3_9PROT|nr:MFS transporter [Lichenicola cladoniae]NPD65221.1 MFS transporter [Acetobacteraceae bacterium]QKE88816.1 MFS transporter [Lichenicola cladoniae]
MSPDPAQPADVRRTVPIVALIVAIAAFMQNLDGAIINTSLPQMARSFGVTSVDLSFGITAYMLASAAISPLAHWLSQRFGSRTVLVGALLTFTFASLWCGLAHSLPMFVAARVAQGFGGALMIPIGLAVVMRNTPASEMMRITAYTVWPALLAPVIGPVLGGFITQAASWRWNFWLNLPIGLAGAMAMLRYVPQERDDDRPPLDMRGFALCALGLTCLLAGFQRSSTSGVEREVAIGLILVGLVAGWAAIRHLRRHHSPLLSLVSLSRRSVTYASLYPGGLFRAVFSTAPLLLPLLFQLGFGLSPVAAGGWVLVYFCGNIGIKPATSLILRRFGFRTVMLVDGVLVTLSLVALGLVTPGTPKVLLVLLLLFAGAVRSMQLTSVTTLAFADIPGPERSAASNLLSMLQQAFSAAGVAIAAFSLSLFQAIFHSSVVMLPELHAAFLLTACICLVATVGLVAMPRDLGREVSGHPG